MEYNVEGPVVRRAEAAGWHVRKVSWIGRTGAPDRVFMKGGRTVWIEFKDTGKKAKGLTLVQEDEHKLIRAAGCECHVCDTAADALRILGLL